MIKYYCDTCQNEIERNYVTERLKETTVHNGEWVNVEIIIGTGASGRWNSGDLCNRCLFDVLDRYDLRGEK